MAYISKFRWIRNYRHINQQNRNLLNKPWMGGAVLLFCVAVALILANIPATEHIYHEIISADFSLNLHSKHDVFDVSFPRNMNIEKFVNDGLMVLFFFLVGLEIKREVLHGHLSNPKVAILPAIAAIGGMVVPAVVYALLNDTTPASNGWAIPTATDIAFAIGLISILGDKVPVSLKIFLTALAVVDDLGAILIIALFYGGAINWVLFSIAIAIMGLMYFMNRVGEKHFFYYAIMAFAIWTLFYYAGIHATMAGVVMALLVPSKPRYSKQYVFHKSQVLERELRDLVRSDEGTDEDEQYREKVHRIAQLANGGIDISHRFEKLLSPYVTFLIMPIFALVNAGVTVDMDGLNIFSTIGETGAVGLGIFFGLLVGKPLGIALFSYLAVKFKLAEISKDFSWPMLIAVACFGGIGFTMSIFVNNLAFEGLSDSYVNSGKIAILIGSFAAATLGVIMVQLFHKRRKL